MMAFLSGWQRWSCEGGILLVAPDPALGVIRVRTGVPLGPLRQAADATARSEPEGATAMPCGAPRALVTSEGEHAAVFEYAVRAGGLEFQRAVAVLLGDHELTTIDGRAFRPEGHDIADKVAALATGFSLGLGFDRWRRFYYAPPAGWHRVARYRAEVWLAPRYPRDPGVITVFHARPIEPRTPVAQHTRLFEELTAEYGRSEPLERQAVKLATGLTGERMTFRAAVDGRTRLATNVALGDSRYLHLLRLETDDVHLTANAPIFGRLVTTVEPIPNPTKQAATFDQWSE